MLGLQNNIFVNAGSAQVGGGYGLLSINYGGDDTVGFALDTFGTSSTGRSEGNEPLRINASFRGTNFGVTLESVTANPGTGEVVLQGTHNTSGTPQASPGHILQAETEDALLIDTNPAKVYSVGNILSIVRVRRR